MEKILSILFRVLEYAINAIGEFIDFIFDLFERQKGFKAEFGRESQISSRFNKGFLISKHRRLTRKLSFQNLLVCSPTGGGKTSRLILKNLFLMRNCSCVINDPSMELFNLSSGYLQQFFTIKTLNFSNASVSSGYNYLSHIKQPSDISKLAHLLVASSLDKGGNSDPFWSIASKDLLSICIRIVLHQPEAYRHMANVRLVLQNLSGNPKLVDSWVVQHAKDDAKLLLDYKALIGTNTKTLQSIIASAKACVQVWDDETIMQVTAHNSIDLTELRQKPTLLFLHNSVGDQKYLSGLVGLFFEQFFNHLLSKLPAKKELDLFIFLEECASIYIPLLPLFLANARKHRVGTLLSLQTLSGQLKHFYKEDADNIVANAVTKLFLPGQTEISVLRELETLGGKTTFHDKDTEKVKPLISIDEIRLLKANRSLIVSGNVPLIKGRTSPYFKSFKYKSYSEMPPVTLVSDIPQEPIALMQ
jgi:type IV secretory pathway TraG/TraD family ATPase VirD4